MGLVLGQRARAACPYIVDGDGDDVVGDGDELAMEEDSPVAGRLGCARRVAACCHSPAGRQGSHPKPGRTAAAPPDELGHGGGDHA
jgi:hypothetical protein